MPIRIVTLGLLMTVVLSFTTAPALAGEVVSGTIVEEGADGAPGASGADAGDGESVTVENSFFVDVEATELVELEQRAIGGDSGIPENAGGAPGDFGDGGDAVSRLSYEFVGNETLAILAEAEGGHGSSRGGSAGDARVSAFAQGAGDVQVIGRAISGAAWGGGQSGAAEVESVRGVSTGGGNVRALALLERGVGPIRDWSAEYTDDFEPFVPIDEFISMGSDLSLVDAVDGETTGSLHLIQNVGAGNRGLAGPAHIGGDSVSRLERHKSVDDLRLSVSATGETTVTTLAAPGANQGGNAIAEVIGSNQTGAIDTEAYAAGGSATSLDATLPLRFGAARAVAKSSGNGGSAGDGDLFTGRVTAIAEAVGGFDETFSPHSATSYAEARNAGRGLTVAGAFAWHEPRSSGGSGADPSPPWSAEAEALAVSQWGEFAEVTAGIWSETGQALATSEVEDGPIGLRHFAEFVAHDDEAVQLAHRVRALSSGGYDQPYRGEIWLNDLATTTSTRFLAADTIVELGVHLWRRLPAESGPFEATTTFELSMPSSGEIAAQDLALDFSYRGSDLEGTAMAVLLLADGANLLDVDLEGPDEIDGFFGDTQLLLADLLGAAGLEMAELLILQVSFAETGGRAEFNSEIDVRVIPEPTTALLVVTGLALLARRRRARVV